MLSKTNGHWSANPVFATVRFAESSFCYMKFCSRLDIVIKKSVAEEPEKFAARLGENCAGGDFRQDLSSVSAFPLRDQSATCTLGGRPQAADPDTGILRLDRLHRRTGDDHRLRGKPHALRRVWLQCVCIMEGIRSPVGRPDFKSG